MTGSMRNNKGEVRVSGIRVSRAIVDPVVPCFLKVTLIPAAKGGIRIKIDKKGRVKGRTVANRDELAVGGERDSSLLCNCDGAALLLCISSGWIDAWQVDHLEYSGSIDDFGTLSLVEEQAGRIVR